MGRKGFDHPDPEKRSYKRALGEKIKEQREGRYSHLPRTWFSYLLAFMVLCSSALWIPGSPSGRLK